MSATQTTETLDTSYHDRQVARRLAEDPEFKAEFERQKRVIASIDKIINQLDALRVVHGLSKAELARAIDKNPAGVRRLLTARGNPELATVVAMAVALDADVLVVSEEPAGAVRVTPGCSRTSNIAVPHAPDDQASSGGNISPHSSAARSAAAANDGGSMPFSAARRS